MWGVDLKNNSLVWGLNSWNVVRFDQETKKGLN